ncbi:LigA [Burkholderia ambifaria]
MGGRAGRCGEAAQVRDDLRLHDRLAGLDPARELQRVARAAVREPQQRLRRRRRGARIQQAAADRPHRVPAADAEGRHVHVRGPQGRSVGEVLQRRLRDPDDVVGRARERAEIREVQLRHGHDAVRREREGRTAERDHRRREPVGAGRQGSGDLQGRREIPRVPRLAAGRREVAPGNGLPAGHDGRVRPHAPAGLLCEEPERGNRDQADVEQAAAALHEGAASGQHAADPHGRRRRAGAGLGAEEVAEGRARLGRLARRRAAAPLREVGRLIPHRVRTAGRRLAHARGPAARFPFRFA